MGLDWSLFSFENFRQILQEIDRFLNEHLENKFTSVFPPKLINSSKWKHNYIISKKMAESNDLTWEMDNVFILKYVPDNLKWHEKDGIGNFSLSNTDLHFKKRKIVNFDIIKNDVDKKKKL